MVLRCKSTTFSPHSKTFAHLFTPEAYQYRTHDEPSVHGRGLQQTVVGNHDAVALEEGGAVVLRGIAPVLEVGENGVRVDQGQLLSLGLLHDADAPVDIRRMTVLQVVLDGTGNIQPGIEGLVAD